MDSHGRIFYIDHLHHTTTWLNPNNESSAGIGTDSSSAGEGGVASGPGGVPGEIMDGAVGGAVGGADPMQPRDRQRQQLDQR